MIDFLGIGAQKSGTSWVYACLYEHPEICAPIKELHFFSRPRFEKGKEWYERHFKKCAAGKKVGEFSTSYLFSKEAPQRIFDLYPDIKLIAILRNPVTRAVSQYKNAIKAGEINEEKTFAAYMAQEPSVCAQGMYFQQLEHYTSLFAREQILLLVYEDSKKDPKAFMQKIYRFLGVDDTFVPSMLYSEINVARTPKVVTLDRVMHYSAEFLRSVGLDKFVYHIRKSGLPDIVRTHNTKSEQPVREAEYAELKHLFIDDTKRLSVLLNRDLNTEWNSI